MTESMQVNTEAKGLFGAFTHRKVDGVSAHWLTQVGRPKTTVPVGTRDTVAEPLQKHIDAHRNFSRYWEIKCASRLSVSSRYVERPKITGFHKLMSNTQRSESAAPQRNKRQESYDQPVAVLKGLRFAYVACGI